MQIGFTGLLTLLFVALKLLGYIDWSWWWITAPAWGSGAVALVFSVPLIILALRAQR